MVILLSLLLDQLLLTQPLESVRAVVSTTICGTLCMQKPL